MQQNGVCDMKKGIIFFVTIVIAFLVFLVCIPIVNDGVARKTAEKIKGTAIPETSEYIESFSAAGKLVGNGNGMQYLGGILIKSELSLEKLKAYYSRFAQNEWEYIVEKQTGRNIPVIEHGVLTLNTDIQGDKYYIVYSWGSNDTVFDKLDIRGN